MKNLTTQETKSVSGGLFGINLGLGLKFGLGFGSGLFGNNGGHSGGSSCSPCQPKPPVSKPHC